MYLTARVLRLADGPDEVHKILMAKNILHHVRAGRGLELRGLTGHVVARATGRPSATVAPPLRHGAARGQSDTLTVVNQPRINQSRRIVTDLPGPRSKELDTRRTAAVAPGVSSVFPLYIERAEGAILVDVDGNSLIDLGSGIAVASIGHAAPEVVEAVRDQIGRFSHTCFMVSPYEAVRRRVRGAQRPHARATTRSARPCSTRAPRPSRTPSRSPAT